MEYVAAVSAITFGAMTPMEIVWELPLAHGRQLEMIWWQSRGYECIAIS